jgi:CRP-like cAMP-binding protein
MEFVEYDKGEVLVRKGEDLNKLYIVSEGSLMYDEKLQKNDVFAEWALLDPSLSEFDLVAASERVEVLALNVKEVEEVVGPIKVRLCYSVVSSDPSTTTQIYVIKKFTPDFMFDGELDFNAEFAKILEKDKQESAVISHHTTLVKDRFTNRTVVRLTEGGATDTENVEFGGEDLDNMLDLTYSKEHVVPLHPELTLDVLRPTGMLGKGQFGVVHRVEHLETKEVYALKVRHFFLIV